MSDAYYITYCFRNDGSLAFLMRDFRTFQGNVREEKRYWIGEKRVLKTATKTFDLQSGKAVNRKDYLNPDSMGWDTIPKNISTFSILELKKQYPAFKIQ